MHHDTKFFARTEGFSSASPQNASGLRMQPLEDHLAHVASLAASAASWFGSTNWGHLAGLWHDLGKYQEAFQRRLKGESLAVEHAGVGARLAYEIDPNKGIPLALAIAGHHGGLPNFQHSEDGSVHLLDRLRRNEASLRGCRSNIPSLIASQALPDWPDCLMSQGNHDTDERDRLALVREMWVRFLLSCVVDADRLDSAAFGDPQQTKRRGGYATLEALRRHCDTRIDQKVDTLKPDQKASPVNLARSEVLRRCREASVEVTGMFSLTVPTGGGKTLSGMSFALNHAQRHGLRRVIVVIPYTSIIEQNASVYRDYLGKENVLEHHSNLDPEKEKQEKGYDLSEKHKLAVENWDAPVIVTTSVQFFETLFASHPSKVRKLHNVARSVIILDEVQTLPPGLLDPILDGLNQLVAHYGCSVVLSTATPPALAARERFEKGLRAIRPIIPDPQRLAEELKRVEISWPPEEADPVELPELATQLAGETQSTLCVIHRRDDARELAQLLSKQTGEKVLHLSALMCPAHRMSVIRQIGEMLQRGDDSPCRVVSTQLIEAGVDLDFPVVYRALGGLDSIVQAAGRCNREGRRERGRVVVFRAASKPPAGAPRTALEVMSSMLKEKGGALDPADPVLFEEYFRRFYFHRALDEKNIQAKRREFRFAEVGRDFRMIEDGFSHTVIVPWGDAEERLARLRQAVALKLPTIDHLRALQPYTISIYDRSFAVLEKAGAIEEVMEGLHAIHVIYRHLYTEDYGLVVGDEAPPANPEVLVI